MCKVNNVTVTQLLSALMLLLTDYAILGPAVSTLDNTTRKLRLLLSVGLRPYGASPADGKDWTGGTVACAG